MFLLNRKNKKPANKIITLFSVKIKQIKQGENTNSDSEEEQSIFSGLVKGLKFSFVKEMRLGLIVILNVSS